MDRADGSDDADVRAAAAQITAHAFANFVVSQLRPAGELSDVRGHVAGRTGLPFFEHCDSGADLSGRAIATLKAIVLNEGGLHGMQLRLLGQTLDGGDVIAIVHRRQAETGMDALAIDQDRAGPALAVIAPLLRAGH